MRLKCVVLKQHKYIFHHRRLAVLQPDGDVVNRKFCGLKEREANCLNNQCFPFTRP